MKDLMETNVPKEFGMNPGMADGIINLVVFIILIVAVSIPITNSVITTANLTGMTATITGYIPLFLALAGLVAVAKTISS